MSVRLKSLLDAYDDDGNYIGDNTKYMDDSEKESDIEYEEEENKQYTSINTGRRAKYRLQQRSK